MRTLVYDGSFAGLLSAVFYVYEYRYADATIQPCSRRQDNLFGDTVTIITDNAKAERVWAGLGKHVSATALKQVYKTFLSEEAGMEDMILRYARYAFANKKSIAHDYTNNAVMYVTDTAKKTHREKHRMEAFVRFKLVNKELYYSAIEPDFNVLPLIGDHFERRYADQRWLIYDTRRKYGIYYDLEETRVVTIDFNDLAQTDEHTIAIAGDDEQLYQELWKHYFDSVNIKARKNMKLHMRHMPKRYWKYLTEKW